MKLTCKSEPEFTTGINKGKKIFNLTKGREYEATEDDDGNFDIEDDRGKILTFFCIKSVFNPS